MWNRVTIVVVGQPVMVRSNWPVAAVILPVESLVVFSVNVPLPVHEASASAIAGTSFEVLRSAVKTYFSCGVGAGVGVGLGDRKSTRLNSSHTVISYAVFCLKKKKKQ